MFYVFHLMECDSYYDSHPPYNGTGDRCSIDAITAGTATQFSILGMSTTLCGGLPKHYIRLSAISDRLSSRNAEPVRRRLHGQEVRSADGTLASDLGPSCSRAHADPRCHGWEEGRNDDHPVHAAHHDSRGTCWICVSSPRSFKAKTRYRRDANEWTVWW